MLDATQLLWRSAHAARRVALRFGVFERHGNLAFSQIPACSGVILLSRLRDVDGLLFGLYLLLGCGFAGGDDCRHACQHEDGEQERDDSSHIRFLRCLFFRRLGAALAIGRVHVWLRRPVVPLGYVRGGANVRLRDLSLLRHGTSDGDSWRFRFRGCPMRSLCDRERREKEKNGDEEQIQETAHD